MAKLSPQTYLALLRGINVGGNSIVSMKDIKASFEKAGFLKVQTYINSGNIIFQATDVNQRGLEEKIEKNLQKNCKLSCKVVVKSLPEYTKIIKCLPKGWDDEKQWRYNVMFLRHTVDSKKILKELSPNTEIEKIIYCPGAIFWAARWDKLTRSNIMKLNRQKIYQEMTVRNLNTTKKLYELMKNA